jgi:hypothetical protein
VRWSNGQRTFFESNRNALLTPQLWSRWTIFAKSGGRRFKTPTLRVIAILLNSLGLLEKTPQTQAF